MVIDRLDEIFSRHGWPETLKTDNGPQFRSAEFATYCEENGIKPLRVTAKWPQANGGVERQNSSIMKRIRIAQAESLDWKKELQKYVRIYRGLQHNTTGRSPAELLFKRKVKTKLPEWSADVGIDLETADRDAEHKGQYKIYADQKRGAKFSDIEVGDQVLVKQDKINKFSTNFRHVPHTVVSKSGSKLTVESESGVLYDRNTSHVKKYHQTPRDNEIPLTAEHHDSHEETPVVEEESAVIPVSPQAADTPRSRPQRMVKLPDKYKDYHM